MCVCVCVRIYIYMYVYACVCVSVCVFNPEIHRSCLIPVLAFTRYCHCRY